MPSATPSLLDPFSEINALVEMLKNARHPRTGVQDSLTADAMTQPAAVVDPVEPEALSRMQTIGMALADALKTRAAALNPGVQPGFSLQRALERRRREAAEKTAVAQKQMDRQSASAQQQAALAYDESKRQQDRDYRTAERVRGELREDAQRSNDRADRYIERARDLDIALPSALTNAMREGNSEAFAAVDHLIVSQQKKFRREAQQPRDPKRRQAVGTAQAAARQIIVGLADANGNMIIEPLAERLSTGLTTGSMKDEVYEEVWRDVVNETLELGLDESELADVEAYFSKEFDRVFRMVEKGLSASAAPVSSELGFRWGDQPPLIPPPAPLAQPGDTRVRAVQRKHRGQTPFGP